MKPDRLLALAVIVVASVGLAALADRLGGLTGVDALRHRTLDWRQTTTATSYRDDPAPGGVTLVLFDALALRFRELKLKKNPECPICSANPTQRELIDYEQFCGIGSGEEVQDEMPVEAGGELGNGIPPTSPMMLSIRYFRM